VSQKRGPAREVAENRGGGEFWIDHASITEKDLEWLADAERLTLWNVRVPPTFLRRLKKLWWLDLRGGSATDVRVADGCKRLRYLQVNQVRGLADLSNLPSFANLELLSLYGLAKVERLPSLRSLTKLRRVEIGQMRALDSISAILAAPALEELLVLKLVTITETDVKRLNAHERLARFAWDTSDVPGNRCDSILRRIAKPPARAMHAIDWFNQ
jgi:hypothetical protein